MQMQSIKKKILWAGRSKSPAGGVREPFRASSENTRISSGVEGGGYSGWSFKNRVERGWEYLAGKCLQRNNSNAISWHWSTLKKLFWKCFYNFLQMFCLLSTGLGITICGDIHFGRHRRILEKIFWELLTCRPRRYSGPFLKISAEIVLG